MLQAKTKVANGKVFDLAVKLSQGDLPDQIMQVRTRCSRAASSCRAYAQTLYDSVSRQMPGLLHRDAVCCKEMLWLSKVTLVQVEVSRDLKNTMLLQKSSPASS